MKLTINQGRLMADLRKLALFGQYQTGVDRPALSQEDILARRWLRDRMLEAGLEAFIDGIGNVVGRTPGHQKRIVIGSHTDTVPCGGWLDGALGVVYGLEIARSYMEAGGGESTGLEVVSFSDEEGRFHPLLGSHFYCGLLEHSEIASIRDSSGEILEDALTRAGFDGSEITRLDHSQHIAYFEAHIEQGPVLEQAEKVIGIVKEIVGIRRNRVAFHGQADHAGTTPMKLRKDAAAALYSMANRFETVCRSEGSDRTVWNLGRARIEPGAYNVVSNFAELFVEYRDPSNDTLRRIEAQISPVSVEVAKQHHVEAEIVNDGGVEPTPMDPWLVGCLEAAAKKLEKSYMFLHSGAGHDAMILAKRIPAAMLFIPSIGGRSHVVSENSHEDHILSGAEVLGQTVADLVAKCR